MNDKLIVLGSLGATYGVRGWIKINSYTHPITNILNYPTWFIRHQDEWVSMTIEASKLHGTGIIAKLSGIQDTDTAKHYTNNLIAVERQLLPNTQDDEYYWHDLLGLTVTTTTGVLLGKIIEVRETGANDVLVITGEKRHLVPFLQHTIQKVDLAKQEMIVDWDHDF